MEKEKDVNAQKEEREQIMPRNWNTDTLYVRSWLSGYKWDEGFTVSLNWHIWAIGVPGNICFGDRKHQILETFLMSGVDVMKLNHTWQAMKLALWVYLFLILLLISCKISNTYTNQVQIKT